MEHIACALGIAIIPFYISNILSFNCHMWSVYYPHMIDKETEAQNSLRNMLSNIHPVISDPGLELEGTHCRVSFILSS